MHKITAIQTENKWKLKEEKWPVNVYAIFFLDAIVSENVHWLYSFKIIMSWNVVIHYIGVETKLDIVVEKSGPFVISSVWKGRENWSGVAGYMEYQFIILENVYFSLF